MKRNVIEKAAEVKTKGKPDVNLLEQYINAPSLSKAAKAAQKKLGRK